MPTDDWERGYAAGWRAAQGTDVRDITKDMGEKRSSPPKKKRKASAYSKRYGAAFRKVAPKYKLKNGSWRKGGFKAAQKAAHKMARK